jgi:hypothetical protein
MAVDGLSWLPEWALDNNMLETSATLVPAPGKSCVLGPGRHASMTSHINISSGQQAFDHGMNAAPPIEFAYVEVFER